MKEQLRALAALFALTLGLAGMAIGQATSGDLVGVVKDASGALLPNATVTVKAESTGVTTTTVSGAAGEFRASNLLPDKYDVSVTASGFQPSTVRGVLIELNKTSTENVTMSIGATTTVEVSADAGVVLDTTSENLSQTFSERELADLPSATVGLGVLNVSLLSPGVASSGGVGIGTGPSVGGQRPRNNNYTIEGIDNNSKSVTGPVLYIPNDSVGSFTLITNQFSPEFGHSSGGQFNVAIASGTNHFHGKLWEYNQNRNYNAASGIAGGKIFPLPRYDFNRYGGQVGGPVIKDKLFFFFSYERQETGTSSSYYLCTPTAAGLTTLGGLGGTYGFNATNLAQYLKYTPAANYAGGAQVTGTNDNACFDQSSGGQYLTVYQGTSQTSPTGPFGSGASTQIPLGNYQVNSPSFTNFDALTTGFDYTITSHDTFRGRYVHNTSGTPDTAAALPVFFQTLAPRENLISLSEFHTFTPNLTNEFRLGYNRSSSITPAGPYTYPGLNAFPNLVFVKDLDSIQYGPDGNAPQSGIQNLYQVVDDVSYVRGKHTIKVGFDGRKYIAPQTFTQRVRGDYEYNYLTEFLHDLAPTSFGQRSTGNVIYYGDQTALYGYGNDTWRISPTVTINAGLRYEFTSVPTGERAQSLNSAASVPGLVNFSAPQPTYTSFAPRFGVEWAPDSKTSIRAGYAIAYDVLFDNLGLLSFPPQYSSTNTVGSTPGIANPGDPNFLANGGLPAGGTGIAQFCNTGTGPGTAVPCVQSLAKQRAATSAFLPNQVTPYAETWNLTIQRTIGSSYTASVGYLGTRGIHLATQDQINVQPKVTTANQLPTSLVGGTTIATPLTGVNTLGSIQALSRIVPAWAAAGFTNPITSYQPYSQSDYNGLIANIQRRFQNGFQLNASYTWSKTMDDATAEVFATVLTPRRQQNSQCISCDYSRSALDRTHRFSLEALYDLPIYKHSNNFILKNVIGNWQVSPIYIYESPEYATVLSGDNANLNGDSATAIDRPIVNPFGVKGTSSTVLPQYSTSLATLCTPPAVQCAANTVGYVATNPNAYYIQAGPGTLPNASRNTLPIRPIDNLDASALKRITLFEHYSFELGAEAFNVLNHAQYIPGQLDNINSTGFTATYSYQTVGTANFNQPQKVFTNNARSVQLSGKFTF